MNYKIKLSKYIKPISKILEKIKLDGGISFLVGGSVRDLVLESKLKDLDIEVHNLTLQQLEKILKKFGNVRLVGERFGVLRIDNFDIDWSLPRKDNVGRKPKVEIDFQMTIEQACMRRDLTINAMAINLNLDEVKIIDPYGGLKDIKNKILRSVNNKLFPQDPLRFFRVMQFIGRFQMYPDKNLNNLCKTMSLKDLTSGKEISKERIFEEVKKLFLKSKKPSLGFRWILQINRLKEIFPELSNLISLKQRPDNHPEGDCFEHTMQALDAAAIMNGKYENEKEKFKIMLAILCLDFGKIQTTDEELHCYEHAEIGAKLAKKFLKRFVSNKKLISFVCKIVNNHFDLENLFLQNYSAKAYKHIALKLYPIANIVQFAIVALADLRGRNPESSKPLNVFEKEYNLMLQKVRYLEIEKGKEKPVLLGRDLLNIVSEGPMLGKILRRAYQIQINQGLKNKKELQKKILKEFNLK